MILKTVWNYCLQVPWLPLARVPGKPGNGMGLYSEGLMMYMERTIDSLALSKRSMTAGSYERSEISFTLAGWKSAG